MLTNSETKIKNGKAETRLIKLTRWKEKLMMEYFFRYTIIDPFG